MTLALHCLSCQMSTETYKEGRTLYQRYCETCHGSNAEGFTKLYPSLHAKPVDGTLRLQYSCLIKMGTDSIAQPNLEIRMPAFSQLSDIEICNILNFLSSKYWNLNPIRLDEVKNQLQKCAEN